MNSFLKKLFEPKSNGPDITLLFLQALKVPVTAGTINKELEEHPNFNSLLSISDVLNRFGVDNLAVRLDSDKLLTMPAPFITQIRGAHNEPDYFSIVKKIDGDNIDYYDPVSFKWQRSKKEDFLKRYLGVALLAEAREDAGERDFEKKAKEEKRKTILSLSGIIAFPVILCIAGVISVMQYGAGSWPSLLYALLNFAGVSAGFLLLWYELDQHNPALQQICSAGKKTNCGAILQSGAAKIAGISWSIIGFSYFAGGLLLMLFTGVNSPQVLFTTGILTLLAFPYTFFSLYYQWRVAQQWCVLCLFVQALLLLQLATLLAAGRLGTMFPLSFHVEWLPAVITAYTLPFVLAAVLLPVFKKARESRENISRLQRLKHNTQIFDALLSKQKQLSVPSNGLGITLGNPSAPFKIIKVCNPYCGPCARAHAPMEALLENNPDVQIQIIFTASNKAGDHTAPPVRHLLAIAASNKDDDTAIKQGLDDWYLAKEKNYEQFATKYPMNGKLKQQEDKIEAMRKWCDQTEISFTPTFFINGYQMPDIYTVEDLKYFLTV
ncbi:vitamin K epoxide reductase family protein [Chitinophaga sp. 22321]|uniref:Thioredoxin domain-containing protein n=1 Tax=Chitinophaga hostae TaxID=2831022 RepID=A0ABS5J5A0_9BACT|nr:vitamin K epoxide reductase family protein [Chitinophaga hostae]MBS0030359.1 thioredoxin domain-containing protein [Chitinophaga hostae]